METSHKGLHGIYTIYYSPNLVAKYAYYKTHDINCTLTVTHFADIGTLFNFHLPDTFFYITCGTLCR